MLRRFELVLCLAALWLANVGAALAHDPGLSSATVQLDTNKLEAVLVFALLDAAQIVEIDKDGNGQITKAELAQATAELQSTATGALEVSLDHQPVSATEARCHFDGNDNATIYVRFPATSFTNLVIRSKWLAMLQPGHRQTFSLQNPAGEVLAQRLLSPNSDSVTIEMDPTKAAQRLEPQRISFADFLVMGVRHIWTGYDHLLFLFGLLIVTRNFASSVKIITCFTIAHSITLAVATLSLIKIPGRFVEPMIAASIVYVGIENLFRGDDPKGRWLLTLGFGLIHGFGFASVLKEFGVGANGTSIAVPLVAFNLGVELGQIAIAAIVLPLIWKLRTYPMFVARCVPACSVLVALLGSYWFVERIWIHPPGT